MRKIIHFSDLHIGYKKKIGRRFEDIITKMKKKLDDPGDYIIVITGDLIEKANETNFNRARIHLKNLREAGFKKILITPGNHDFSVRWGVGADWRLVKEFNEAFFGTSEVEYPNLTKSDDGEIAFIGLNSMEGAFGQSGFSRFADGRIGEAQLTELHRILGSDFVKNCKVVIYLHHHPFKGLYDQHKLHDAEQLCREILKHRKVNAILFGHNHIGTDWNGFLEGVSRCYDAGSSTRKMKKPGQHSEHRIIDLSLPPNRDFDGNFHGPI